MVIPRADGTETLIIVLSPQDVRSSVQVIAHLMQQVYIEARTDFILHLRLIQYCHASVMPRSPIPNYTAPMLRVLLTGRKP